MGTGAGFAVSGVAALDSSAWDSVVGRADAKVAAAEFAIPTDDSAGVK
jgi:hypothetical protein